MEHVLGGCFAGMFATTSVGGRGSGEVAALARDKLGLYATRVPLGNDDGARV